MRWSAPPDSFARRQAMEERVVREEGPVLHRPVDAHEVLVDDPPGAEVRVAHLGVPHLPLGEPDGEAARLDGGRRVLAQEGVHVGRPGERDGVRLALLADAPAVEDDEEDGLRLRHGKLPGGVEVCDGTGDDRLASAARRPQASPERARFRPSTCGTARPGGSSWRGRAARARTTRASRCGSVIRESATVSWPRARIASESPSEPPTTRAMSCPRVSQRSMRRAKAALVSSAPRSSSRTTRSRSPRRARSASPSSSFARGVPACLRASGTSTSSNLRYRARRPAYSSTAGANSPERSFPMATTRILTGRSYRAAGWAPGAIRARGRGRPSGTPRRGPRSPTSPPPEPRPTRRASPRAHPPGRATARASGGRAA